MLEPIASPMPIAASSVTSTVIARSVGSTPSRRSWRYGRATTTRTPPAAAPASPSSCGKKPDRQPAMRPNASRTTIPMSIRFTGKYR
jgi:hypothetical protein